MARTPFNVLVFLYHKIDEDQFEYVLLKRADAGFWHTISGGVEDGETFLEAARREAVEEAGIPIDAPFIKLDTITPVPVTEYRDSVRWGDDLYVIPQYSFGAQVHDRRIVLSHEHTEYRWTGYEEAHRLVEFEGSKIALWELDHRLRGLSPRE